MKLGIGAAGALMLMLGPATAFPVRGDGGMPRLWEQKGNYRIAVFTAPTPPRAGPVDLSVYVQDAATGKHLPEVRINVELTLEGQPGLTRRYPATAAAATNKLFQAAQFELPAAGRLDVKVHVAGPGGAVLVGFILEAVDPLAPWEIQWPWFTWPALVIVLFVMHQWLAARKGSWSKSNGTTRQRR